MTVPRAAIVVLALLVSPSAAAACEIACATPSHATHQVPADPHAHHHMPDEAMVAQADGPVHDGAARVEASTCDLSTATLARPRHGSVEMSAPRAATGGAAVAPVGVPAQVAAPESPHAPPHRSATPLRI